MLLFLVYLYAEAFSILYLCAPLAGACDDGPRRRAAAFFIILRVIIKRLPPTSSNST